MLLLLQTPFILFTMSTTTKNESMPRPVVFCGPSGVGKGTLIELLMKRFPNQFGFSVSHATRKPRDGEVHGQHYNFTTVDQMKEEISKGKFIEYPRFEDIQGRRHYYQGAEISQPGEKQAGCHRQARRTGKCRIPQKNAA